MTFDVIRCMLLMSATDTAITNGMTDHLEIQPCVFSSLERRVHRFC